ncbi:DNA replication endonuclease-helicase Dna2 [Gnomoniopsis smithogilvyi]|uniref:DNA replication ATP-dependent helicase/nuclease n=1 Tax=Gnomoniopsis smithogilvyi TaxID=1191159 RepID=A0A9W8YXE3_9PEZI|nr:DNA replication endonuclease-helicase Dna2 [Gnomoniopsis smithogilvyi]
MPLQKSFSEQSRFPKQRQGQWQRSNTHSGSIAPKQQLPKPPPISVSAKTKSKLQQFQFQKTDRDEYSDLPHPVERDADTEADALATGAESNKENKVASSLTLTNAAAATPASRLAWQDLMGAEDAEKQLKNTSPEERLQWHIEQGQVAADTSPLVPRRRKKRARSSSPVSSPAVENMKTPRVSVKNLRQAMDLPRADPALDLWDRFSVGAPDSKNPLGVTNPALAHLMVSSSPRPSKDAVPTHSGSGLRRAMSCGSHWPKRRRVESAAENDAAKEQGQKSKSSLVTALLETVNDEINKSDEMEEVEIGMESPSFKKRRAPTKPTAPSTIASSRQLPKASITTTEAIPKQVQAMEDTKTPSSDYEDDDFDDDTMLELDASLLSGQVEAGSFTAVERVLATGSIQKADQKQEDSYQDEFDDVDDDLLAAAAENMLAEVDPNPISKVEPSTNTNAVHLDVGTDGPGDTYEDDFGADFDFEAVELAATQSVGRKASSLMSVSKERATIQRYLVMNSFSNSYTDDRGREAPEVILVVQAERSHKTKTVHLRGDWIDTPAHAKSFVHVIGNFDSSGRCIIDNNQNILVLHPDQLISATVVADSFSCMRRAVLQDRVKATSEASAPLVYGTLLHEIFQEALLANNWDQSFLNEVIERTMKKHVQDLYAIKVSFTDAREHMSSKMPEVRGWAERFISSYPKPEAIAQGRNNEKTSLCVSKLLDIEEHVWSPLYGLKGNIDATIQVTVNNAQGQRTLTVPFEVKTGKNVSENHQAQTMLYNLLLTDRYDIEIVYGILYYMETSLTKIIPAVRNELRHMIKQRNQLAVHIRERSVQLPPMKKSKHMCGKCYAQTSCFIYHKLADDGDGDSSGVKERFDEIVKHLTPTHREFFLKWEDLLTKEEKESQKLRRELWTMLSAEREKVGRCFGNVIIEEGSAHEDLQTQKINRFNYTFIKHDAAPGFSFVDSQLAVGEPIVVSDEQGHFALALGFVTSVRKQRISVAVDRRLHNARIKQPGFDEQNNQVYASIMDVVPEGVVPDQSQGRIKESPIKFRLDKDEFSNGMALVRNNIVSIMANSQFGSEKIRNLVVDLAPPEFKSVATQYTISDKDSLNPDQRRAIEKVMSAKDYALVLGMPGTGKTTTIAHIIRALIAQNKSVLLTSYTHTAVDNILLKLRNDDIPILRLGAPAKIHPEVRDFAILAGQPMETFEEIRSAWHDTPVVATTCLGTSHGIFNERTFDYCIVDEASQITLPICLGPIRMARTFVLVGDHNQLPPLVQNEEARLGGLDVSLFKLLSDTYPDSVVNLEHQYRMSEDIMALSNTLIYEGRLKCGTEELRQRKLDIPNMSALQRHHFDIDSVLSQPAIAPNSLCTGMGPCWLHDMVDPETRVSFINTDRLPSSREESKGSRIVNPCEARIVTHLVDALLTVGVPACEIGVMTHYRSQLSLLKHHLRGHGNGAIEMHTADRFQGRDKEVVILSLVRSNEACNIGDLLKDWRRINVAFTRAKTKLLVVGSKSTLKGSGCEEMLARFIGLMEARCWIYDLKPDSLEGHIFEHAGTQMTVTGRRGSAGESPKKMVKTPNKRVLGTQGSGKENLPPGSDKGLYGGGKVNAPKGPAKRARPSAEVLLKGKPNVAGILNDMMGGIL